VHPLAEHLAPRLREVLPGTTVAVHQPWRDVFLPLMVGATTVLLPDGRLPGGSPDHPKMLEKAGFKVVAIDSEELWMDPAAEVNRLVGAAAGAG
ncbi:MAG: hypothetical protein AAFZ52_17900, partial [Bacteroidota bacterium]